MLVWLNGACGAGKTTVAYALQELLPGSVLFDPELLGPGLRAILPKELLAEVAEVPELAVWRRLVADAAAALLGEVTGPLLTPVSLFRREHRDEIFGALAARRIPVAHFLLRADETILRARIEERSAVEGVPSRLRSLRQLPAYRAALPWLAADAHAVDTSRRTPRQTAEEIAEALRVGAGDIEIVQTPEPSGPTVASGVLLFDELDRVLLVDPTYKPGWEFPGGVVERGEAPALAAEREVAEELGLQLSTPPRLLVVDWEPPRGPSHGGLRLLFDGGRLAERQVRSVLLPRAELRGWRFVTEDEAATLLPPARTNRLRAALRARRAGRPCYMERGVPERVAAEDGRAAGA